MVRVEVITDDAGLARGFVVEIEQTVANRTALNKVLGNRLVDDLQDHFRQRDTEPNKRGWPKSHFWADVAQATQLLRADDDEAVVTIADQRFPIHLYGGTVRPREKKALTIPLHPMAKGKFVRTLEDETGLEIFRPKKKGGQPANILAAIIGDRLVPLYALVTSATIPRDPRALPPLDELASGLAQEARAYLDRQLSKSA